MVSFSSNSLTWLYNFLTLSISSSSAFIYSNSSIIKYCRFLVRKSFFFFLVLKNYDYVIVPYTEEEYNKMLDDVNIKDNPKLKDETDLYMFKLVPKKYIK